MTCSLSTFLSNIEDPRRKQGLRYPMDKTLLMIVMSIIDGASSYRRMGRFMIRHEKVFIEIFKLKHGVPSYVSIRKILQGIDLKVFNEKFIKWMSSELDKPENQWLSIDGKSIRSTLKNANNKLQSFVNVVNIFSHSSGLVIGQNSHDSKKALEAEQVRQMVRDLDKEGLFICLDALHCQKKL